MILVIDTTNKECEIMLYENASINSIADVKWYWKKDTGTETLENINKLLKKLRKKLEDLKMILVNHGPGSFTGVRVGVTMANTLGWSLNIPVIGYREGELDKVFKNKITKSRFSKPVLPYYSK